MGALEEWKGKKPDEPRGSNIFGDDSDNEDHIGKPASTKRTAKQLWYILWYMWYIVLRHRWYIVWYILRRQWYLHERQSSRLNSASLQGWVD